MIFQLPVQSSTRMKTRAVCVFLKFSVLDPNSANLLITLIIGLFF